MTKALGKGSEVKVKIIAHGGFSGESTEKRINNWLVEHPNVEVLDIRYSESIRENGNSIDFYALIIYKIAVEKKKEAGGRATRKKSETTAASEAVIPAT